MRSVRYNEFMGTVIAVDMGGTHLRAATYESKEFKPSAHERVKTLANEPGVFDRMIQVVEKVLPRNQKVDAIGIAAPGPLDPHTGYMLATPNIKQLDNFALAPKLSQHFGVPAFLDNDANMACLGEW